MVWYRFVSFYMVFSVSFLSSLDKSIIDFWSKQYGPFIDFRRHCKTGPACSIVVGHVQLNLIEHVRAGTRGMYLKGGECAKGQQTQTVGFQLLNQSQEIDLSSYLTRCFKAFLSCVKSMNSWLLLLPFQYWAAKSTMQWGSEIFSTIWRLDHSQFTNVFVQGFWQNGQALFHISFKIQAICKSTSFTFRPFKIWTFPGFRLYMNVSIILISTFQ